MAIKVNFAGISTKLPGGDHWWQSEYSIKAGFHFTMEKLLWPDRYEWIKIINPLDMTYKPFLRRKPTAPDMF